MQLIRVEDLSLRYDQWPLLDKVNFNANLGERVCLIGRNGEGKSSFLKVLAGVQEHDSGILWTKDGYTMAYVGQDLPLGIHESVFHYVCGGLPEIGAALEAYHELTHKLTHDYHEDLLKSLEEVQHTIDALDGWKLNQRVESVLEHLGLDANVQVDALSGGWRRRVSMARALVCEPDILLLDEPTNHLDIEGITWLESFLLNYRGTLIYITHDRAFLKKLATRIVELDRGTLTSWPGDYDAYLEGKATQLELQERENALFDKKLAKEEVWIRQGVKARRTRNEGRVRALKDLRDQRKQRREKIGDPKFAANLQGQSGKIVIAAKEVSFSYPSADGNATPIISHLNLEILRGDKLALIGPNGVGKTTLIKLLLTQLAPTEGTVKLGTNLEISYFDQTREQLNPEETVFDNVAQGKDSLEVNGKTQHVFSYLNEFLFSPEKIRTKAKYLSGGEANRLMLAKLFAKPSNVLVLDEPTNDLDIESLELLENILVEYPGTVLLISHDRDFIENVSTHCLVFHPDKSIEVVIGGYQDYVRQIQSDRLKAPTPASTTAPTQTSAPAKQETKPSSKSKLSYKEQRELESLPQKIDELEKWIAKAHGTVNDPQFYNQEQSEVKKVLSELQAKEAQLADLFSKWQELDEKNS